MADLEGIRQNINSIDKKMRLLFEERMQAAAQVAEYKQQNNLPVLDSGREAAVIQNNIEGLENPVFTPYYTDFLKHLMGLSRQYQTEILGRGTVAYQGTAGGFGHHVATALYPHAQLLAQPTFAAVFEEVQNGTAAFGVVPFENSSTGDVAGVLDLCYSHQIYIADMYDLPVTQNLLGLPGAKLADIEKVVSHVQALEQSSRFLESLDVKQQPFANTALAAEHVAKTGNPKLAAIASLEAAERFGLSVLAKDISTQADNTTRFIIITKQRPIAGDRFSLLVTVQNTVGQLSGVIQTIAASGFNMESIKSRPMPQRPWEYYFYIELVGAPDTQQAEALLAKIREVCLSVRMLGIFHRAAETVGTA